MRTTTRHVAILGAGAVGLTFAAFLLRAGHRVRLITGERAVALPQRFADEIGRRELVLGASDVTVVSRLAPNDPVDVLFVCVRSEQLEHAIEALGAIPPAVPVVNASPILADLSALLGRHGLQQPAVQLAVGFATWPTSPGAHRVFALGDQGTAVGPCDAVAEPAARWIASMLVDAGLPARAFGARTFRWVFRTLLATDVAFTHAHRLAGWDLARLAADPALLGECGRAMQEAAAAIDGGGPVAALARAAPASMNAWMIARRARASTASFREVWRYHGPKIEAQLRFVTAELAARGQRPTPTLDALAAR